MTDPTRPFVVDCLAHTAATDPVYTEVLRVPAMSAGVYALPDGSLDRQRPHSEDEVYVVVRGTARFTAGAEVDERVGPGRLLFVPRRVEHRFHEPSEDFTVVVVFAPAEADGS